MLESDSGVPICTTGPELAQAKQNTQTCVDCHMPRLPGPSGSASDRHDHASHPFPGPPHA